MAHICPEATEINDSKNYTPQMRRELFPTNDDDSDELGHISPLSNSTPPDSPSLSPGAEDRLTEQNHTSFYKNSIADYIILENICNNDKRNLTKSMEITEDNSFESKTPLSSKHGYESNDDSMPPLYLSPMQSLHSDTTLSPRTFKDKDVFLSKSPSFTLKTPQSTSNINLDVPKLVRKSPLVKCSNNVEPGKRKMPFSESPVANKHLKLDAGSKVRTVLFPKSEIVVPTTSFYAKSNISYLGHTYKNISVKNRKTNQKSSSLYLCGPRGIKKRFGQINAGVTHKIKKPRPKRVADAQLLKVALDIIDNSPLNNYLNDIKNRFSKQNGSKSYLQEAVSVTSVPLSQRFERNINNNEHDIAKMLDIETTQSRKRELSPPPDPNKKFFKFRRSNATVTVDKHLKLEVSDGKFSLMDNKKSNKKYRAVNQLKVNLDATDLIVPEHESLISPEKIDDILFSLDNDSNKENDANSLQVKSLDEIDPESTEQLVLTAHTSVAMSENAIHLHTSSEKQRFRSNNLSLNCSLVPRQQTEKSILLSPTSQMCSMTSGLALNSPKKAKQNISNILDSNNSTESLNQISFASEMEQEKLFPIFYGVNSTLPKGVKCAKVAQTAKKLKPLPKNQMLLDAGQKKFGITQCTECKFVYHMGDPNDELLHLNYHNAGNVFRFNGWKDERIVAQFTNGKIIRILPSDPKPWLRKAKDLIEIVNRDLGYYEMQVNLDNSQVFLYIKHKTIAGCLIAEPKSTAFRMLSDDIGIDLCSEQSYSIKCGISRIWVSQSCRKEGIATALVNSLRGNFAYGTILAKDDIALSSPTEAGLYETMPRKHKHVLGTPYRRNYDNQKMEDALQAVIENNMSFGQAAERYGVPKATLYKKYRGEHSDRLGKPPAISVREEKLLAQAILIAASFRLPFNQSVLKDLVQQYLNRKGIIVRAFQENRPGKDWCEYFLLRNPKIAKRNCENIKRCRAELDVEVIQNYFEHLGQTIHEIPPENIINYDESNITDDPGSEKVFVRRGTKHASRIMDSSKTSTSIMFAASADGNLLRPYIVYRSKYIYPDWIEGGPEGARYNRTVSGWFDSDTFEDWFMQLALSYLRRKVGKKVIIGDNLGSHLSYNVIKACEENNIDFVFLPKNSTHICQPLDVAVFRPLKISWRKH